MKKTETFTDRKLRFESRFDDPAIFDCGDFNILKIAQHAVVRDRSFDLFPFWRLPVFFIRVLFLLKRARVKMHRHKVVHWQHTLRNLKGRKHLIIDVPRKTHDAMGQDVSLYFERIVDGLGRQDCIYILGGLRANGTIDYDLCFRDVYELFAFKSISKDDRTLLKNLRLTFMNIEKNTRLTRDELHRLKGAIEIFWRQYRTWRKILEYLNPSVAMVIPHYQTEFLFLALKRKKIKTIEMQHGLIANEDIFYIYPDKVAPVVDRALFADRLFVYGDFWRQRVERGAEYRNKVVVSGFYPYRNREYSQAFLDFKKAERLGERTVILITVQKGLEGIFEEYIHDLSKRITPTHPDALILVKPHPSPRYSIDSLNALPNVRVMTFNLEHVMPLATIHVSIYSTTLYDALLYGIKHNFALYVETQSDYVEAVLRSGVAEKLLPSENPLLRLGSDKSSITPDPGLFFEEFNLDRFRSLINS